MKPNFSLFDLLENGFGVLFSVNNLLCTRKTRREFRVYSKRKNTYFHVAWTATGKREKWRESHNHVVTFADRVSREHDAKFL